MSEINIARISLALIGLFLLAITVLVCSQRCRTVSRDEAEQAAAFTHILNNDELSVFLMPDGSIFIPAEELEGRNITFHFTPKP